jgi:membrane protease YdiL (CAAX protease family)
MRDVMQASRPAAGRHPGAGRLWPYTVLPAVLLNLAAVLFFVPYYALRSVRPDLVAGISATQVNLSVYAMLVVAEWSLAIAVMAGLRRSGRSLRSLLAPDGSLLRFRLVPAVLVFLGLNLLFGLYVATYQVFFGGWPKLTGAPPWERLALLGILPVTAAYCEELVWRGRILTGELARGRRVRPAIVVGAIWFSLIHGVFLPDKLLVTFVWGLIAGAYYLRERNLLPLMATHLVTDLWSFALSAL